MAKADMLVLNEKQYAVLSDLSIGVMRDHRNANLGDLLKRYKTSMSPGEVKDLAQDQGNLIEVNPHGNWLRVSMEGFAAMRDFRLTMKKPPEKKDED